jgi:hypothetical protein
MTANLATIALEEARELVTRHGTLALVGPEGRTREAAARATEIVLAEAIRRALHRLVWSEQPQNSILAMELAASIVSLQVQEPGVAFVPDYFGEEARLAVATLIQRAICTTRSDCARSLLVPTIVDRCLENRSSRASAAWRCACP